MGLCQNERIDVYIRMRRLEEIDDPIKDHLDARVPDACFTLHDWAIPFSLCADSSIEKDVLVKMLTKQFHEALEKLLDAKA